MEIPKKICCENLRGFQEEMKASEKELMEKGIIFQIFNLKKVISFDTVYGTVPGLVINFCPYCGAKQQNIH